MYKVISRFHDLETDEFYEAGDDFKTEITEAREKVLMGDNAYGTQFIEKVEESKEAKKPATRKAKK